MRFLRLISAVLASILAVSLAVVDGGLARAQSVDEAEQDADSAQDRADAASGLVDEAVAERERIELQLTETISRVNDLAAELSFVGASLDRTAEQLGYADIELASIKDQIEVQAVDAYMTVLGSPTVTVVNSGSVERALVASAVVEDVVAAGRETVDELVVKRQSLEDLQETFLAEQAAFQGLQDEVNQQVERLMDIYAEADATIAVAIADAEKAAAEYRQALSALDLARARDAERRRQEGRSTTTTVGPKTATTSPGSSPTTTTTTSVSSPTTTTTTSVTSPTTTAPSATTTSTSGGTWNHPPAVEQWRPLVQRWFPSHRVEEALRIIDCESNGDPNAVNPYSGASGLFQFLPSTWATTAPKAGWAGHSVLEPEPNVSAAAWLANRYEELGQYYWQAWSCRRLLG